MAWLEWLVDGSRACFPSQPGFIGRQPSVKVAEIAALPKPRMSEPRHTVERAFDGGVSARVASR